MPGKRQRSVSLSASPGRSKRRKTTQSSSPRSFSRSRSRSRSRGRGRSSSQTISSRDVSRLKKDLGKDPNVWFGLTGAQKDAIKQSETDDERRARRMQNKNAKATRRRLKEEDDYFGYSNDNNPFNDRNLTKPFVWDKKYEKIGIKVRDIEQHQKYLAKRKKEELREEISKTQVRRQLREEEEAQREQLQAQLARERELEENAGWARKEEDFHKQNAIARSKIRIEEGREHPIDVLARNIEQFDIEVDRAIPNPLTVIQHLQVYELNQVLEEIPMFKSLGSHVEHWEMIERVVHHELVRKHKKEEVHDGMNVEAGNETDDRDIEQLLQGYNAAKLEELETHAKAFAAGDNELVEGVGDSTLDVEYWEKVQAMCQVFRAKRYLSDRFDELQLRLKARDSARPNSDLDDDLPGFAIPEIKNRELFGEEEIPLITMDDPEYSKCLKSVIEAEDALDQLEELRSQVLHERLDKMTKNSSFATRGSYMINKKQTSEVEAKSREDEMFRRESRRGLAADENQYNNSEVEIPRELKTTYGWFDKYRPRKPRYYNRVKTGYSWNKYNQTHYDPDNPPPKIVQGYKFDIFYPDLIDADKPPTFKVYEKRGSEYATIVFSAGPPYEDIAFKIVNNEWEPSHRRGYRCRFEKGIFSLYFNFKRFRYRR